MWWWWWGGGSGVVCLFFCFLGGGGVDDALWGRLTWFFLDPLKFVFGFFDKSGTQCKLGPEWCIRTALLHHQEGLTLITLITSLFKNVQRCFFQTTRGEHIISTWSGCLFIHSLLVLSLLLCLVCALQLPPQRIKKSLPLTFIARSFYLQASVKMQCRCLLQS